MSYLFSLGDNHGRVSNNAHKLPASRNGYYQPIAPQPQRPYFQKLGMVISVPKGLVDHYGIVACDSSGAPTVISNSLAYGRVVEQTWADFTQGQPVTVYWGATAEYAPKIIHRARKLLRTPYNIFSSNCEHFVREVYGFLVESPQLQRAGILATIAGVGLLLYAAANEE